ncbi:MAG: hypothetical protein D6689_03830 [Deltaproteobacteria bacterium]|nr:MAG: hypothetical protein D6689_03830 [Deltaproteobacteria bacterium]
MRRATVVLSLRWGIAAVAAAALAACFDAPKPACAFLCGSDGACPDGYACAADGWCKRADVDPAFQCDPTVPPPIDAASADGAAADAAGGIDGAPGPDAAAPDAAPPAPDAAAPDAAAPDAAVPDAAVPDAAAPDAAAPDAGLALGSACTINGECNSGFCSDGVCCDAACDGPCDACKASLGATADGTCTLVSGVTCRPSAGDCDVAETCDGTSADCPADQFVAAGTSCPDPDPTDCMGTAQCDGMGTCSATAPLAAGTPCGAGIAEPTCNPDVCDDAGVCTDVPAAMDETACAEQPNGDCCGGVCTDTSGTGGTCP